MLLCGNHIQDYVAGSSLGSWDVLQGRACDGARQEDVVETAAASYRRGRVVLGTDGGQAARDGCSLPVC